MTTVSILNDTSRFHHGSAAVMRAIFETVDALGWTINASFFGNTVIFEKRLPVIDSAIIERSDVLIVNGEGTFHDDSRMAKFLLGKISEFRHKTIVVLNLMWERMGVDSERCLQFADLIVARDPRSQARIRKFYTGNLFCIPDLSIFRSPPLAPMTSQGIVFGGFYWPQHSKVSGVAVEKIQLRYLTGYGKLDIVREDWHAAVNRLRHARLLVSGKHHDVMAACVARCPFLYCPISTSKIEALGDFAGLRLDPLDLSRPRDSYRRLFEEAIEDEKTYDSLYSALERSARSLDLVELLRPLGRGRARPS